MATIVRHPGLAHTAHAPRRDGKWSFTGLFCVARQRRALARLDDTRLEDIGISRAQAEAEANRPFWDAPSTWIATR